MSSPIKYFFIIIILVGFVALAYFYQLGADTKTPTNVTVVHRYVSAKKSTVDEKIKFIDDSINNLGNDISKIKSAASTEPLKEILTDLSTY